MDFGDKPVITFIIPAWTPNNPCPLVQQAWNTFIADVSRHENVHLDSYISIFGNIKSRKAYIHYCELVSNGSDIAPAFQKMVSEYKDKIKEDFEACLKVYDKQAQDFEESEKNKRPLTPILNLPRGHSIIRPCGCQ